MSHYFENDNKLKSEVKELSYKYDSFSFTFLSDNGVFSKKHIDYGSKLLLENYLKIEKENNDVLDVGCGYGFLGIVIGVINKANVDMIDLNKRAIHLTERNIKKYKEINTHVFLSDSFENVNKKYDSIITNPPIRVGKEKLLEILFSACDHLKKNGTLYFVIRKDQGALSVKKILETNNKKVELLDRDKGFHIYSVKNL